MKTFFDEIMQFDIDGLRKLNSITKYPSILTYHNLGPRGSLVDSLVEDKNFHNTEVYITEKIDGTNSRIVFSVDEDGEVEDFLIGSREDILFAKGDRIVNPALGIVKNMKEIADTVNLLADFRNGNALTPNSIYCLYGETYGGKINNAKQYSSIGNYSVRVFDLWIMPHEEVEKLLDMNIDQIASWREHGGQPFVDVDTLEQFCQRFCIAKVPYIRTALGEEIPLDLQGVWEWMQEFARSDAAIDATAQLTSEGIVVRLKDRSLIRKIRFEDYQKTKKMGLIK